MGLKSNFQSVVMVLSMGFAGRGYYDPEEDMTDGRLAVMGRHRIIRNVLSSISNPNRRVLETYYETNRTRYPTPVQSFFEDLTSIVVTQLGLHDVESLLVKKDKQSKEGAYTAKSNARKRYQSALEEFTNAWSNAHDV